MYVWWSNWINDVSSLMVGLDEKGWQQACNEQMTEFKYETLKEK